MVAAHDEMGAAVVFADQPMPDGLTRASHAHGEVQQGHGGGGLRILIQHRLVTAHAGKVIDVAGFCHANNRVDQQVCLRLAGGPEGQFLMRTVQGIACLEGDNLAPAEFAEIGAQFIWRVAPGAEIIMHRLLDAGHGSTQIDLARLIVQIVYCRMGAVVGAKDLLCLMCLIRGPAVADGHGGENHTFLIAQGDVLPDFQRGGEIFGDVQRDRHRPKRAISQPHIVDNAVVIFFGEEALKRVEPAVHQQFQIADLAGRQIVADKIGRLCLHLLCGFVGYIELRDRSEICQHAHNFLVSCLRPDRPVVCPMPLEYGKSLAVRWQNLQK